MRKPETETPSENNDENELNIECEELDQLNQAEDMIKWFLRQGNDILAAELIKDCPWNYKLDGGRLIRQDNLLQVIGSKMSTRRVFLFEKLVIICKPKLDTHSGHIHLTDSNQRFVYKDGLKTNDFGLTRKRANGVEKQFEIWQSSSSKNLIGAGGTLSRLAGSKRAKRKVFIFQASDV